MKKKLLCESLEEFRLLKENTDSPLALAVLGAPASGKSFTMSNITRSVKDARIANTLQSGTNLTVDVLRNEFQSKDPKEQMKGFVKSYYYMKKKAKSDPEEYSDWFKDIQKLWKETLSELFPQLKITVDEKDLKFQGKPAIKNLKIFNSDKLKTKEAIEHLDNYKDYKRVVRYFQHAKQEKAIQKQFNVSYDESGDEPQKIVKSLNVLHNNGYVTDVFLIHPENVATNIIQNYFRVIRGNDEGRDSSEAIVQAYLEIEKNKNIYKNNAEDVIVTTSKELQKNPIDPKIENPIEYANVEDDQERGNKPIDIFAEVRGMKPLDAWNMFSEKLEKEQQLLLMAILKYRTLSLKDLPKNAKQALDTITSKMTNQQALKILKNTAESGKYIFKLGGVTPKMAANAEKYLK